MSKTTQVVSAGPLYSGGIRTVVRNGSSEWGPYIMFCVSGTLYVCSDESAIITLDGNYDNSYVLLDAGAVTRDPLTGTTSFITSDNVEFALREPTDDEIDLITELGYNSDGTPAENEDTTNG